MNKKLVCSVVLAMVSIATAGWVDNFDSYADQAALDAVYTQLYDTTPMMLDGTLANSAPNSVHPGAGNVNYTCRMYLNFGEELVGTDAAPLEVKFNTYIDTLNWHTREYIEIRGYEGAGYGDGALQELIAQGSTSSGVDTSKYAARTFSGNGWESTGDKILDEWVELKALIKTDSVEYYVNGSLYAESARAADVSLDCIVIGSGLSSAIDMHFDDLSVQVVPEPASLALLGLGAFALIRRR